MVVVSVRVIAADSVNWCLDEEMKVSAAPSFLRPRKDSLGGITSFSWGLCCISTCSCVRFTVSSHFGDVN